MMLSVIIPNYNHAHLIGRAIDALVTQSHAPDEIFIVDDDSSDNSVEIIAKYAARFPQIKVLVADKNVGLVGSLNRGLESAAGRYIYLAAADDWVEPGFLATAVEMLERHPQSALFCGEVRVVEAETGQALGTRPPVRPLLRAGFVAPQSVPRVVQGKGHWVVGGGTVYRREHVVAAGGLDARLGSFADGFLARKLALTHGFCFAPGIVATWNVYSTGLSREVALHVDRANALLVVAQEHITADASFPPGYARNYSDLWRFSTARLAVQANPVDHAMLESMACQSAADRLVKRMIWSMLPDRAARLATMAWLWIRFRPYSPIGLIRTRIVRRFG